MDWDGNHEDIRQLLTEAEAIVCRMVYEDDPTAREEMCVRVSGNIIDTLIKVEKMTRHMIRLSKVKIGAEDDDT